MFLCSGSCNRMSSISDCHLLEAELLDVPAATVLASVVDSAIAVLTTCNPASNNRGVRTGVDKYDCRGPLRFHLNSGQHLRCVGGPKYAMRFWWSLRSMVKTHTHGTPMLSNMKCILMQLCQSKLSAQAESSFAHPAPGVMPQR